MALIFQQDEDRENAHLKRAFIPTPPEIVMLLFVSFLLLLGLNSFSVIRSLDGVDYVMLSEFVRSYIEKILAPTDNQRGSTVLTIIFWMFVGLVVYIITWVISSLMSAYRSDVSKTHDMVLPQGSTRKKVYHESVLRLAVRLLSTIMFFYWLYLLLAGILPFASFLFLENIAHLSALSLLKVMLSVLVLAGSIFVAMVFARCTVLRERVFGE